MIGVLAHDSALQGYTGPGTTWEKGNVKKCIKRGVIKQNVEERAGEDRVGEGVVRNRLKKTDTYRQPDSKTDRHTHIQTEIYKQTKTDTYTVNEMRYTERTKIKKDDVQDGNINYKSCNERRLEREKEMLRK